MSGAGHEIFSSIRDSLDYVKSEFGSMFEAPSPQAIKGGGKSTR